MGSKYGTPGDAAQEYERQMAEARRRRAALEEEARRQALYAKQRAEREARNRKK